MLRKMNDAPNENKENSLKNVELKNNNFDKTKVKNNTVNRFKDFLSKNNKLDSNNDALNENKENSLKNVELKNNNFDKTKVKNNTVNRFKDFLSKNNKLDSNTDNKNSTGKDIPSIKNQILKTPDKTIKHSETNVDRFDQNKGMKEFLDGKRDLVKKNTEAKAENKSEAKVEKNTEAKVEKYTEAKVENKSEAKAEKNTETKAENKAEAKVEKSTEAKVENKSEAKAEKNTEAKAENKSETKAENKSEAKAENKSETKAENKSEAKAENKSENKVEKNAEAKVENKAEANDVTNKHQDINIEKQQLKNNNILNRNDTKNNQINRFKNFLSENNKIDKNIDNKDYRSNDVSSIKNQILQTPERMPNPLKINEDRVSQNNNEVNVENNAMKYFVKKHNTDVKNNEDVMVVKSDLKSDLRKALENDLNTNLDSNDKPKKFTDEMIDNIYKNYLDYLEQNTSYDGKTVETNIMEYTDEEIRDIAENDRGYINERAMKTLPAFELNNNTDASVVATNGTYLEFGFQRGLDNWKPDKVPGTEKIIEIEKGKVFDRYGNENGSYMTDAGTEFKDLHMIVSEDKVEAHTYEVVKSFKANSSIIASQDFDDYKPEDYNEARQYIALDEKGKSLTIKDLLEQGYIREVKGGENSVHDAGENVKDVKYNDSYMDKTNNRVSMMEYIDALYKKSNVEDTDSSDEDNNIDNNISLQKNKGVERVRSWTNTRSENGEAISSNLNYSNETKNKNILTNDDINRQRQIIEDFKHSLKVYNEEKAKDDADEWER